MSAFNDPSHHQDGAPSTSPTLSNDGIIHSAEAIIACIPMARGVAWKFARTEAKRIPADELFAEALLALTYAHSLFDPNRGVPFKKYAMMVICHRLRNLVSRTRRHEVEVSLPRLQFQPDQEWHPEAPDDFQSEGRDLDAQQLWNDARDTLPPRQFEIIHLHYRAGCSLTQIGRRFGISRQRTCQLLNKARIRLRNHLVDYDPKV